MESLGLLDKHDRESTSSRLLLPQEATRTVYDLTHIIYDINGSSRESA